VVIAGIAGIAAVMGAAIVVIAGAAIVGIAVIVGAAIVVIVGIGAIPMVPVPIAIPGTIPP